MDVEPSRFATNRKWCLVVVLLFAACLGRGQTKQELTVAQLLSKARQESVANHWDRAAALYQRAAGLLPPGTTDSAETYYWLARAEAKAGHYAEAQSNCRVAIGDNPTNADYVFELGYCLQKLHQPEEAIDTFKRALGLNPNNEFGWLTVGGCYYADGNYPLAAMAFERAVTLNPRNDDAFDWLSRSYSESTNFTAGERASRESIQINPTNVFYYVQLGYCQDALREYPEAIGTLKKAVALETNYAVGLLHLGVTEYHAEAFADALGPLKQCLEIEPTNARALYWLGSSYEQLDRHADAANAFDRELKIDPDNFGANLGAGMSLLHLGDFDTATARLERAAALENQDASVRPILFSSYLLSAHYQKAYQLYPLQFSAVGGVVGTAYVLGLGFLFRYSLRVSPRKQPGLGFCLGWLAIFFEGQLAFIAFFGLLSLVGLNLSPLTGITLAALPVIYAAVRAFPQQPWGTPFSWPPKFGTWNVVVMGFLGLILCILLNMMMESVYIWLTRMPMPGQDTLPFFKYALARSPITGCLGLIVLVPMAEEIIFRGLLQSAFARWFSTNMTVVLSAAAFAFMHLQPLYITPLFCLGLLLGWARVRTGSLGLSMLLHITNNGVSLLMLKMFGS